MAGVRRKQSLAVMWELRNVHYSNSVIDTAMPDETAGKFDRFARLIERQVGSPIMFVMAVAILLIWAISGPFFGWSDTWQLVITPELPL